jgi:hypothetical protein
MNAASWISIRASANCLTFAGQGSFVAPETVRPVMASLRDEVRDRANDRCEYCRLTQAGTLLPHELDPIRAQKHHPGNGS